MILLIPAFFPNVSGKIKLDTLSFLLKGPLPIAKHSKCILSFMGVSDFKIIMFKNRENKAQMNEKIPTLHKSRYL